MNGVKANFFYIQCEREKNGNVHMISNKQANRKNIIKINGRKKKEKNRH